VCYLCHSQIPQYDKFQKILDNKSKNVFQFNENELFSLKEIYIINLLILEKLYQTFSDINNKKPINTHQNIYFLYTNTYLDIKDLSKPNSECIYYDKIIKTYHYLNKEFNWTHNSNINSSNSNIDFMFYDPFFSQIEFDEFICISDYFCNHNDKKILSINDIASSVGITISYCVHMYLYN
jgi:hypothetical protein